MLQDIFINVLIIVAVYLLAGQALSSYPVRSRRRRSLLQGVFGGGLGLLLIFFGMHFPALNMYVDLRHIPIIVSAVFLNGEAALVTAAIIAAGRMLYGPGAISFFAGGVILLVGAGCAVISRFIPLRRGRMLWCWLYSVTLLSLWYYRQMLTDLSISPPLFFLTYWSLSALAGGLAYRILHTQCRLQEQEEELRRSLSELQQRNEEIQAYQQEQDELVRKVQLDHILIEEKNTQLEEQRQQLSDVLESIEEVFLAFDASWRFAYVNRNAEPFLNQSRELVLGKVVWEKYPKLCGTDFEVSYRKTMEERVPCQFESYYEPLDCWFDVRTYPAPEGITVYVRDITERKLLELQLREQNKSLKSLVYEDALTGIGNRRFFDKKLLQEWAHARQAGQPLALLMIDIDYFKLYNDHFGHDQGDRCLQEVAAALKKNVRTEDYAVRYGGEEFAVLMRNTTEAEAAEMGARLVAVIAALRIPHSYAPEGIVTVSIGAAARIPGRRLPVRQLLLQADRALYKAKEGGRNRTAT